jgi:hypothetical protein
MANPVASYMALVDGTQYFQGPNGSSDYPRVLTADQALTFYMVLSNGGNPVAAPTFATVQDNGVDCALAEVASNVTATNLIPNSNDLSAWGQDIFNAQPVSGVVGAATGPDGTPSSAMRVTYNAPFNGAGAYEDIELGSNDGSRYGGRPAAFSFWARTDSGTVSLQVYQSDWPYTGDVAGIITVTVTPVWQRFMLTGVYTAGANSTRPILRYYGPSSATIYVWGVQQEIFATSVSFPRPGPLAPTSGASLTGQGAFLQLKTASGGVGVHSYRVRFTTPSATYYSAPQTWTVTPASPTLSVTAQSGAVAGGQTQITVNMSTCYQPTGLVSLKDTSGNLIAQGTASVTSGNTAQVVFNVTNGGVGSRTINVTFAADANNNAASSSVTYSVGQTTPFISVTSTNPATYQSSQTLTAILQGYRPTGSVQFAINGQNVGSPVAVTNGGSRATYTATETNPIGNYTVTAQYLGDSNNTAATSQPYAYTVQKRQVTVAIQAPTPNPGVAGQNFSLQAQLVGDYEGSGTITFSQNGTTLGVVAITSVTNGGSTYEQATLTTNLNAGTYQITAAYSGDSVNAAASTTSTVNVAAQSPTLSMTVAPTSITVGNPVTLTATITGGDSPTGTVVFYDGSNALGTVALSNGVARLITSALTPGTHQLSCAYSGDTNDNPATFSGVQEIVNQAMPTISVISPISTQVGAPVTVQATISGGYNPTGSVTFSGSGIATTTVNLDSNNRAQTTFAVAALGTETITCTYSGDTDNQSVIGTTSFTVTQAAPALLLESNLTSVSAGQSITLTALPSSGFAATGTVEFLQDGHSIGVVPVQASSASIITGPLVGGNRIFVANYSGDALNASASGTLTVPVSIAAPQVALSVVDSITIAGEHASLVANMIGGYQPTGTITFTVDGVAIGSSNVVQNVATIKSGVLSHGTHLVTAAYSGDAQNQAATSATLVLFVERAPGVVLNPAYPNRIQLRLGFFLGPLATADGTAFNPGRDLEVFVDGTALPIQNFTFDAAANRYLLFAPNTIPSTSLVQVTHHMPLSPFKATDGTLLPGFSRVGKQSSALDFLTPQVSLSAPLTANANTSISLIWSAVGVSQFRITASNGYDSTVLSASAGSGALFTSSFTAPGTYTLTISGLDAVGNPVYFAGAMVQFSVSMQVI